MGFTLWIRMLDCNQTSKHNRNRICVATERQQDTGQLIKNEGKTEERKNLFTKRIKDDQTRCSDIQKGSKMMDYRNIFQIFWNVRERSKQTTTRNGKHSCYNKEF